MAKRKVDLIFCHGGASPATRIAAEEGWLVGARSDLPFYGANAGLPYTFIDWDFKKPNWDRHIKLISQHKPKYCTAPDIYSEADMPATKQQVEELSQYSQYVIVVPKIPGIIEELVTWNNTLLGYSVPTKYGSAENVPEWEFAQYPVHLLGGGPKKQWELAQMMNVVSVDCKAHMRAASFGGHYISNFKRMDVPLEYQSEKSHFYISFRLSSQHIISRWRENFDVNT